MLFTEDFNEMYLGDVDVFLTLLAFQRGEMPFLRNPEDKDQKYRIVPAYLSIYDGFGMYAGAYTNGTYWEKPEITA